MENASIFDALTTHRDVLRSVGHSKSALDAVRGASAHQSVIDFVRGASAQQSVSDFVRGASANESVLNFVRGAPHQGVSEIVRASSAQHRALMDSILSRPSFAKTIGAYRSVSDIVSEARFASMIGTAALERPAWERLLGELREPIGADLYADAVEQFDVAEGELGEGDGETWWLVRLPLIVQLGLLQVVLQSLDAIGQAAVSLSGGEVPQEYQDGSQVLFALATILYAVMAARAAALSKT